MRKRTSLFRSGTRSHDTITQVQLQRCIGANASRKIGQLASGDCYFCERTFFLNKVNKLQIVGRMNFSLTVQLGISEMSVNRFTCARIVRENKNTKIMYTECIVRCEFEIVMLSVFSHMGDISIVGQLHLQDNTFRFAETRCLSAPT